MTDRTNAQVALECATRLLAARVDQQHYRSASAAYVLTDADQLLRWLDDHTSSVDQP